jgi:hypothetical protein
VKATLHVFIPSLGKGGELLRGPAGLTTRKERPVSTEQKPTPLTAAAEYDKTISPHHKLSHNSTAIHQVASSPFRALRTDGL